jgi:hypothetical protein
MLYRHNQHKIRNLLRDCTEAEKNGNGKPRGYHGAKFVANPTTVQDLDRLFDEFMGEAVDDSEADTPRDAETELWLDELYDDILELERKTNEKPPNGHP